MEFVVSAIFGNSVTRGTAIVYNNELISGMQGSGYDNEPAYMPIPAKWETRKGIVCGSPKQIR